MTQKYNYMNIFFSIEKNQSDRAMAALQTLSQLSPVERAKLQAALQSLNNNSYLNRNMPSKPEPVPKMSSAAISPFLSLHSQSQSLLTSLNSPTSIQSPFDLANLQSNRPDSAMSVPNVSLKTNMAMYHGTFVSRCTDLSVKN